MSLFHFEGNLLFSIFLVSMLFSTVFFLLAFWRFVKGNDENNSPLVYASLGATVLCALVALSAVYEVLDTVLLWFVLLCAPLISVLLFTYAKL